ncbi:MAG: Lrp/AsnC family transcriptional regulator [Pseudomonadota bacterium]
MLQLDQTDLKLLREIQREARISNVELSERLNLSPTPCLRRLRKLEDSGVIRGYETQLDSTLLGFQISALAFVKLTRNSADNAKDFEKQIQNLAAVVECNVITGAYDYVLRIVAKNLEDYERILKNQLGVIRELADIESTIILKQVECSKGLPL